VLTPTGGALTGSTTVTVGGVQTVIVNTYRWTVDNTGGGTGLTTNPSTGGWHGL
jgi:hypothetical protein